MKSIPKWIIVGCACLAINAGFVNTIAVLGFANNPVSHVTGTVTIAAEAIANQNLQVFKRSLFIVVSFFLGSILSGILIKDESLKMGRNYGYALLLEVVFLIFSAVLFEKGFFAGELLASLACGLQNSLVTSFSGTIIRTTHMTGVLTDLGSSIGIMLANRTFNIENVRIHILILGCFIIGVIGGTHSFHYLGFNSLYISCLLVLVLGIVYIFYVNYNKDAS